jgi:hypothetical protein
MTDLEFTILKRIADGPLPMNTAEAQQLAPLERYREMNDALLVEGTIVKGAQGEVTKVRISGLTHFGRQRLDAISQAKADKKPAAVALRLGQKALWAALGIGGTLLAQWLAKLLKLD